jgi:hypothetical protein
MQQDFAIVFDRDLAKKRFNRHKTAICTHKIGLQPFKYGR